MLPGIAHATAYSYTVIDFPGAFQTRVTGINNLGQIVGTYTGGKVFTTLTGSIATFTPPFTVRFGSSSDIYGLNSSGTVIGGYLNGPTSQPQYYVGGVPATTEYLNTLLRNGFTFGGINDAGQYVTNSSDFSGKAHSYLRTGIFETEITVVGAKSIYAYDINTSGQILGSTFNGVANTPFILTGATFTFPKLSINPVAFNAAGVVAGEVSNGGYIQGAVQSGTTVSLLDAPGSGGYLGTLHATHITDINDAGTVVGYFFDSQNLAHGFIATPLDSATAVPAPGAGALVLAAFGMLAYRRRR